MVIREFQGTDADFCFKTRTSAFIINFYDEIGAEAVSLGINSILPADYIRLSTYMKIFIVEDSAERIGFFTIKRIDNDVAEIPLIYFVQNGIGKGFGRKSIEYIEEWICTNWKGVKKIFLDTIIPKYNGGFYRKMNYQETGESVCVFSGKEVKARRFEKYIS
jgi:GNAT superfamily N-acetyltransferase